MVVFLINPQAGDTAIMLSVREGLFNVASLLIEIGANVSTDKNKVW